MMSESERMVIVSRLERTSGIKLFWSKTVQVIEGVSIKVKVLGFILYLLFAVTRIADMISTYNASPDLKQEVNVVVQLFGDWGWLGIFLIQMGFIFLVGVAITVYERSYRKCLPEREMGFGDFFGHFAFGKTRVEMREQKAPTGRGIRHSLLTSIMVILNTATLGSFYVILNNVWVAQYNAYPFPGEPAVTFLVVVIVSYGLSWMVYVVWVGFVYREWKKGWDEMEVVGVVEVEEE